MCTSLSAFGRHFSGMSDCNVSAEMYQRAAPRTTHLAGLLDRACPVHAEAILLPERALAEQVDLIVLEEGLLDKAVEHGEQLLVDGLDRLVRTVSVLYRS